jgi:DNA-binding transcriptional MerR regulator
MRLYYNGRTIEDLKKYLEEKTEEEELKKLLEQKDKEDEKAMRELMFQGDNMSFSG